MSQRTRIVVPKVQARLFRLHKSDNANNREEEPQQIIFRELENLKNANDDGRIKGVEHETTALFGGVVQLNIGEDPTNEIFEETISNDHLEVFYRDIGDPTEIQTKGKIAGHVLKSFGRHKAIFARKPQFFGPVWKPEHTEKPTSVNTQLNAWDYLRIMQYYNIPRGKGQSTQVKLMQMKEVKKNGEVVSGKLKAGTGVRETRIHSDLLDYMDHAIELYLSSMYNVGYSTVMTPVEFSGENDDLSIDMEHKDLHVNFVTVAANTTVANVSSRGIPDTAITDDYPNYTRPIIQLNDIEEAFKIDEIIEAGVNDADSLTVIRFMDARLNIANGLNKNGKPTSRKFRMVGEVVAIDQFGLAKLITGAIAYDHGMQNWYTPIVDFDDQYIRRMREMLGELNSDEDVEGFIGPRRKPTLSVGKLVYIRFRAGEITRDRSTVTRKDLHRIAVFNRDSFGEFMEFFSNAPEMNFHTIAKFIREGMGGVAQTLLRHPSFLSLAVSIVNFPQSRYRTPYTVYIDNRGDNTAERNMFDLILEGAVIDQDTPIDRIMNKLKTQYLVRSSAFSAFIATAFKKDDKFISFMTNIPASYMRADIFTGSKYKTFSYDSLSIIRIVQILSSTMGGFPATNNPVQVGGGVGKFKTGGGDVFQNKASKVDNYPIFLANRVIIEPMIIFAKRIGPRTYSGYQSVTRAADIREETQMKGYFFLRLQVGIRDQVIDREDVEFEIPVGKVNDLSLSKGTAINHIFRLSFAENMEFLKNLTAEDQDKLTDDKNGITLTYKLGGQSGSASLGAIPPELNILTLRDMTQNATYDPLHSRAQVNRGVLPKADGQLELPVHHPEIGWANLAQNATQYNQALVVMDTDKSNFFVIKQDIVDGTGSGQNLRATERLIGIKNFVDISDLIKEIKTLRRLAASNNVSYGELSSSRSDKTLFELIEVVIPFKFVFGVDDRIFDLVAADPVDDNRQADRSLKTLLDSLEPLENITELDMAWSLPLSGYNIENYDEADLTVRDMNIGFVNLENNPELFQNYMPSYAGVVFLDLLVKGIRYLLWTLSKSRFLGHIYLPADHVSYAKGWEDKLKNFIKNASGEVESDIPRVAVGSSIIFDISKTNLTQRDIVIGGGIQGITNKFLKRFKKSVHFAKSVITGAQGHKLKSFNIDGDDAALIWYVSKKIVYIGRDSGYMMRLNMTEGSFDWTLFHREDTIITRLSEFYLLNGMNNFMVSRGGI